MTYERILVGYDGSAEAEQALDRALELRGDAGLVALTVCEEAWAAFAGVDAPCAGGELHREAERAHLRAAARLQGVPRARALLVRGRPADALLSLARKLDADLIVVGRRPRRFSSELFGDVGGRIVRSAPCSVLVVGPATRGRRTRSRRARRAFRPSRARAR